MRVLWEQISLEHMEVVLILPGRVRLDAQAMAKCNWLAADRSYRVSLAEEVVIPAGHQMVVTGKILAGVLPRGSCMVDSLSKPPGGKCLMVGGV